MSEFEIKWLITRQREIIEQQRSRIEALEAGLKGWVEVKKLIEFIDNRKANFNRANDGQMEIGYHFGLNEVANFCVESLIYE